ncbi:MAG: adenosine deaminase [Micrococcaceae bacterium]
MSLAAVQSQKPLNYQKLPKVSLHDHLDGGLRPETIIELAAEQKHMLPTTDPIALRKWFEESSQSGSLVRYLETFKHTTAVMQTKKALIRVAWEAVEDLAADGVIHAEIRYAPELHANREMDLDEVVEAVQEGINLGVNKMRNLGYEITVRQILSAMRNKNQVDEIAELAVRHRDKGVAGFDIAGPEYGFPASRHVSAFNYLQNEFLPVTIHAGEAAGIDSIVDALNAGHALRLGHGVRIMEDIEVEPQGEESIITLGKVAEWVRDRKIPLEICPTSNLHTGAISAYGDNFSEHPLDLLYRLGFNTTINTDNRLMSGITLSEEYESLVEVFDYTVEDLKKLSLNAAQSAFLSYDDQEYLKRRIELGYSRFIH